MTQMETVRVGINDFLQYCLHQTYGGGRNVTIAVASTGMINLEKRGPRSLRNGLSILYTSGRLLRSDVVFREGMLVVFACIGNDPVAICEPFFDSVVRANPKARVCRVAVVHDETLSSQSHEYLHTSADYLVSSGDDDGGVVALRIMEEVRDTWRVYLGTVVEQGIRRAG